jgi:hypothetical protein
VYASLHHREASVQLQLDHFVYYPHSAGDHFGLVAVVEYSQHHHHEPCCLHWLLDAALDDYSRSGLAEMYHHGLPKVE